MKSEFDSLKQKYARLQHEHDRRQSRLEAIRAEKHRLHSGLEAKEKDFLELMSKLQLENTKLSDTHEMELENIRTANNKQITSLQMELQKQRNRSMDLISEKDYEIEKLQKVLYDQDGLFSSEANRKLSTTKTMDHVVSSVVPPINTNQSESIVNEILSSPSVCHSRSNCL